MKQLILNLDFINDIVHINGKIANAAQRIAQNNTIKHANEVISWGRSKQIPIVHVKVGFSKNYIECPKESPLFSKVEQFKALLLNSWGTEFIESLDVSQEDAVLIKHRISPFYATKLESILTANQIDTIIIMGVATNMAVEAAARDAHDRDYKVIIISDACETSEQLDHEAALKSLSRIADIKTSEQLITS